MQLTQILRKVAWRSLVILFLISIITFVVLISPVILALAIYRTFVWILLKLFRPDLHGFVTKVNTQLVLFSPTEPTSNIIASLVVNGYISMDRCREIVQNKILQLKNDEGKYVYKRLNQSWENFWGYACWKTNSNFDVTHHVRDYNYEGALKLPTPCTETDFEGVLGKLVEAPWKADQSPWEALVVHNYVKEDSSGPKTLIIFRCDHVLADGYSLLGLLRNTFECPFVIPEPNLNIKPMSIWKCIWCALKMPYDAANTILLTIWKVNLARRDKSGDAICCISTSISVETIKTIKRHYKVCFAAVTQFIVQGTIARTLRSVGKNVPAWLSTSFIMPLPNHPDGMCIHASPLSAHFPCEGVASVRLQETHDEILKLTRPFTPMSYVYFLYMLGYLPVVIRRWITLRGCDRGPDYIITHFPVASSREYLDGLEVLDVIPSLSSIGSIGMTVASGGVNGAQRFTFFMDRNVFESKEAVSKIKYFMEEELHALLEEMV